MGRREKVLDGTLDSVSVVFINAKLETVKGFETVVSAEPVACDVVSIPRLRSALILSTRSMAHPITKQVTVTHVWA